MTDTIPAQMAALAVVEAAITGVLHAFEDPPDAAPSDLPCFINFPGASNLANWPYSDEEAAEANETRAWECRLLVAARGTATIGEVIRRCKPFYDLVRDAFQGHQQINSTAGVLKVTYLGDNGLSFNRLNYAGQMYSGIIFRVQIVTRVRSPYAPGQ